MTSLTQFPVKDKPPDPREPDVQTPESIAQARTAQAQERATVERQTGLKVSHDGRLLVERRETLARTLADALHVPLGPEEVWALADGRLALAQLVTHFGAPRVQDWLEDEAETQGVLRQRLAPTVTPYYCPGCDGPVLHGPSFCGACGTSLRCEHCGRNQCLEGWEFACQIRKGGR